MRKLIWVSLLVVSCSVLRHTERAPISKPEALANPEVAELAKGAKVELGGKFWTFAGVEDSEAVLISGKVKESVLLKELQGREFILSTSRLSGTGCLLGGLVGAGLGGGVGCLMYKSMEENPPEGSSESCLGGLAAALAFVIVLALIVILGAILALVGGILGATCAAGVFGAKKVQELKARARKLREALK